ncbi:MAG: hypothetical protein PHC44_09955 [Lutispora sp.]|nr:hypothetical protein [Lutispora sp.]
MTKDAYRAMIHHFHKGIYDISFPTTKLQIIEKAGTRMIKVDYGKKMTIKSFVEAMPLDSYSSAAEFYCALLASLSK